MSVDVKMVAVDLRMYRERFLLAYHAAETGDSFAEFASLLRSALDIAPELQYKQPYESPWDDPDMARRRVAADAAKEQGDLRPWKDLVALLDAYVYGPPAPALGKRPIADALAVVESGSASTAEKVRVVREIGPQLVDVICLPWGRIQRPWLNLTRSELTEELTRSSETLAIMLAGFALTGGSLEVTQDESAWVMSRADLARFTGELAKVPRPTASDVLQAEYDEFRELVDFVQTHPDFALVITSY